jgi:hypothetical protein
MARAGLRRFDQVQMDNANDLYRLLINNQRKEVVIPVERDGKALEIRASISELDLSFEKVSLLLF